MHESVYACVRVTNRCSSYADDRLGAKIYDVWETWNVIGVGGRSLTPPCFGVAPLLNDYEMYILYEYITTNEHGRYQQGWTIAYSFYLNITEVADPSLYRAQYSRTQKGKPRAWVDIIHTKLHDAGRYSCMKFFVQRYMHYDIGVLGE